MDIGIRLTLLLGDTVPQPAPADVIDSLRSVEVKSSSSDRGGLQMTFAVSKGASDYSLIADDPFKPPARVILIVTLKSLVSVLFDGIITNHQLSVSNAAGESTLTVTGEDVSGMLDLKEKSKSFKNTADTALVRQILAAYPELGFQPEIPKETEAPAETERVMSQQGTDLKKIAAIAKRNSFIFYVEPTRVPRQNKAYFGPMTHDVEEMPPIRANMGSESNIDAPPQFTFNALGAATPMVFVLDPKTQKPIQIQAPSSSIRPLSLSPAPSLREVIDRGAAKLSVAEGTLRALALADDAKDTVTCSGELDAIRYGDLLVARRRVKLFGVGSRYDGLYYVREVTHSIRRGQYKQSFRLSREGHGALPR